jgi:hypothetical protein
MKKALTGMIAVTHHMSLAWDFTMTVRRRQDWFGWQGQPLGKQHLLRWHSQGT